MPQAVQVKGLVEFQRALKQLDGESQKQLRLVFNDAAELVAGRASRLVPVNSGKARRSVRALSTQREGRVAGGSGRVPYYPWLDFGGSVGRKRSVRRKFLRDGRYIYASYNRLRPQVIERLEEGMTRLIKEAGLDG